MLIATDLDGTLLQPDLTLSPRTRAAVAAARRAGVPVVPVTARQPIGLRGLAAEPGLDGWAVCANGALGLHLGTGEVLVERPVAVATQQALAEALLARHPGTLFVSIRDRGEAFVAQRGYRRLATFADHKRPVREIVEVGLAEVLAEPSLKLVCRHPGVPAVELLRTAQRCGVGGFEATVSGAPFLEVSGAGVTKGSGLAALARRLGVAQRDVVAFGDAHNDIAMLRWAGVGVAMGDAGPEVRAAADRVTGRNVDDGVAVVVEELLAARATGRGEPTARV